MIERGGQIASVEEYVLWIIHTHLRREGVDGTSKQNFCAHAAFLEGFGCHVSLSRRPWHASLSVSQRAVFSISSSRRLSFHLFLLVIRGAAPFVKLSTGSIGGCNKGRLPQEMRRRLEDTIYL